MYIKLSQILAFFFAAIFVVKKEAYSQETSHYSFSQHGPSDGLGRTAIFNLYKDNYGFLWISNAYGVSFYNGKEFSSISQYTADKTFYFGDAPHNFLQLDGNRLLITCSNGLYIFHYRTRELKKLAIQLKEEGPFMIRIMGFNQQRDRIVLKIGQAVYLFDLSLQIKDVIPCINGSNKAALKNEYTLPYVFYYTNNKSLAYINIETRKTDSIPVVLNENGIVVNGQLSPAFVVGNSAMVLKIDLQEKRILKRVPLPAGRTGATFFANAMKMDRNGVFWLGGEANLFLYNAATDKVVTMNNSINHFEEKQINANAISDIWIDTKDIFIGAFNAGLFEYNEELNRFKDYYLSDPGVDNTMYTILVNGDKLLGANTVRGIYEFSINGNGMDNRFHPVSKRTDPILQLEYLNKDYLWVLYQEEFKLGMISRKGLVYRELKLDLDTIAQKYFFDINGRATIQHTRPNLRYCNDQYSYCSIGKSLYSIYNDKNTFRSKLIDSLAGGTIISCICNAPQSQVVVASNKGALYLLSNGKLIQKTANINEVFIGVKSIDTDSTGKIFVLTSNGLYIYNPDFSLYKIATNASLGLLSDKLFAGKIDGNQVLWISSGNGLIAYDTRHDKLVNFASQGLFRNAQFFSKSISADENGTFFFGGSSGITAVKTMQSLDNLRRGQLYFSEIRTGGRIISKSLLSESLVEKEPLAYNNNSISFSFGAISYKQAATVYYKYKLEGFDTAWNLVGRDKTISFLSLPPGSYKLIVKEFFPHQESGSVISYSFKIKKPFWTTGLFMAMVALAVSILIILAAIIFMRRKMEKQRIKASLDIALKSERERISQDLHDELGTGLTSIRLLAKTVLIKGKKFDESAENILMNMSKISGEMIDQMGEIVWVLNNSDGTFSNLLAHVRFYISDFIMRTQVPLKFSIKNSINNDFRLTNIQRRNILLVIKEAFNNTIKHAGATFIHIEADKTDKGFVIVVEDNGVGFSTDKPGKGNGVNNMQKRISAIGGKITFEKGRGCRLIIEVPGNGKTIG